MRPNPPFLGMLDIFRTDTRYAPAMHGRGVRFEVVDEDKWEERLNGMLFSDDTKPETKSE